MRLGGRVSDEETMLLQVRDSLRPRLAGHAVVELGADLAKDARIGRVAKASSIRISV